MRHILCSETSQREMDQMNDKKKKRIVQIAVVLLIAAVVITYSVTFVGAIFY